jgi:hypothetical protein
MSLTKSLGAVALGALLTLPLCAQTQAQSTGTNPNDNPNTSAADPSNRDRAPMTAPSGAMGNQTGSDMSSNRPARSPHHGRHRGGRMAGGSLWMDSARLATLLQDAQTNVTVSAAAWTTVVNEANTLANRIYTHAGRTKASRDLAMNLRKHVRQMRASAMARDAAGVRTHAQEAMPYATQLTDWASPKQRM